MKLHQYVLLLAVGMVGCDGGESRTRKEPASIAICGNGRLDAGELCDGDNLGGATCYGEGFGGGVLRCAWNCVEWDASSCDNGPAGAPQPEPGGGSGNTPGGGSGNTPGGGSGNTPGGGSGNTPGGGSGNTPGGGSGNTPGGGTSDGLSPGSACNCSSDCSGSAERPGICVFGICMQEASASCSSGGSRSECGAGASCWGLADTSYELCWPDCDAYSCAGTCDADGSCAPSSATSCDGTCSPLCNVSTDPGGTSGGGDSGGTSGGGDSGGGDSGDSGGGSGNLPEPTSGVAGLGSVGAPCASNADCGSAAPDCVRDGFPGGYCTVLQCTGGCPGDSACYNIDDGQQVLCLDQCTATADCRSSYDCTSQNICFPNGDGGNGDYRCTATSCGEGYFCGSNGLCIPEAMDMPGGVIPDCRIGAQVPDYRGCNGPGQPQCTPLVQFNPVQAYGYWDYQINGEGSEQYRSWIRQDVMQTVRYATAFTECLSQGWSYEPYQPLGLGDMSEGDGAIPGASRGSPGHPAGTHVDGSDMDIAYYQLGQPNNVLRSVCNHVSGGSDQYHCVGDPDILDKWRTAVFIAKIHDNYNLRVIGVDGKIGELMTDAIQQLCGAGWIGGNACTNLKLAYETEDTGAGWFRFHHHHLHISINEPTGVFAGLPWMDQRCMTPGCWFVDTVDRQRSWDPSYVSLKRLESLKRR